ncbi:MAG TPA: hypothetical protein VGR73_20760 [Bryobacteraceae bacterium]|nr:hypothetical protein [Bryobacteraceae bacterium]
MNSRSAWLVLCLWAMPALLRGQDQTPPPGPPPEAPASPPSPAAPPKPKYTPSIVDTGNGASIEPMYWLTRGQPVLRRGDDNNNTINTPGDLNYPGRLGRAPEGMVTIPIGRNDSVHVSYFQTQMTGTTTASQNLNFFNVAVTQGDPLAARLKVSSYKASYEFLTYFWERPKGDLRLKTLWEMQYVSVDNTIDDFVPQSDGTFLSNPAGATKSIFLPTFGLALDQSMGEHFRWEVKGSGFGLPHRSILGDAEADIALRYGRVEFVAGGRTLHFRTTRRADHYDAGTLYGPYVGVRLYWRKK